MLRVRDVMTADPVTIPLEASLRDAVELLSRHGITGVPVLVGGHVVGTLSAGNIIAFEARTPGVPAPREEGDIWDPPPVDLGDDSDDQSAGSFVDWWEDAGADVLERFNASSSPEWDVLGEHTVAEAMSTDVVAVAPGLSLACAARYMRRAEAHRALVVEAGRLVGVLTTTDMTRAIAGQGR
jgi:CBS domain-containing protein